MKIDEVDAQEMRAAERDRRETHRARRERIATACLAGILADQNVARSEKAARFAVECADALIAELDKEPS